MNQTRVFLFFAWLMVATLLWMEWGKFNAPKPAGLATATSQPQPANVGSVPSASPVPQSAATAASAGVPVAPAVSAAANNATATATAAPARQSVVVSSDLLRLTIDGGNVLEAVLLKYPQSKAAGSPPVVLFTQDPAHYYTAQSGWTSSKNPAPNHLSGFVPENGAGAVNLAPGAASVSVPFVWNGPSGVVIRRTYTLKRDNYAVDVRDEVVNNGGAPWEGTIYRQLERQPPVIKTGMTNPESFSFSGATWYSVQKQYERLKFAKYMDDGKLNQDASGSWIAMLQHHFFSAWIPDPKAEVKLQTDEISGRALIRELGPGFNVAPGQRVSTDARLYVGPKLIQQMKAQGVPGLDRAVDYSQFSIFAVIGQGLFWILSHLHSLFGNWGWSIIGLVVLVKLALYPLANKQYESANKMRALAPRVAQLRERYGDDRAKQQAAMMELYKKEKVNPMGGCLPILVTMPIFLALYWVLVESVELRQAPWFLWIQDLTARDPYFILPALNMLVMWTTQKMTPAVGMDPMQQKMMQFMPLVFGVMMAFFPSGLVLYWVTNGSLGLLQQWWVGKKHGKPPAAPEAKGKAISK
ncbi:membrane protein insertase YidC [Pseudoxanthomonas sp. CF125]|uniref:membrane protein insertase YidC n=1 Tax=Pseudoxanthomonas sp. CF125 TaxID=1855303 RepID=UPI0008920859|nr:membrane protein insertase YidC [Pseudoxanthomonas sp. CF125]SDR13512.1 YidC/Oxa1 family membrane protein insertase [Pseudoxanthomonas sp. CF125]